MLDIFAIGFNDDTSTFLSGNKREFSSSGSFKLESIQRVDSGALNFDKDFSLFQCGDWHLLEFGKLAKFVDY